MNEKKCWRCDGNEGGIVEMQDGDFECLPCAAQTDFENSLEVTDEHNMINRTLLGLNDHVVMYYSRVEAGLCTCDYDPNDIPF